MEYRSDDILALSESKADPNRGDPKQQSSILTGVLK